MIHHQSRTVVSRQTRQGTKALAPHLTRWGLVGHPTGGEALHVREACVGGDGCPNMSVGAYLEVEATAKSDAPDILGGVAGLTQRPSGGAGRILVDTEGVHSGCAAERSGGNEPGSIAWCCADTIQSHFATAGHGFGPHVARQCPEHRPRWGAGALGDRIGRARRAPRAGRAPR